MTTYSGKYDPSEFLFPSYDPDGRSVRLCVRVPLSLHQAIEGVVESQKFPFEIKDDLTLWCLNKGLETLQSMNGCIDVMPLLMLMVNLFRVDFNLKRFQEFFAKLDTAIIELTKSDFRANSARRLVKAVEEVVLCVPSGRERCWFLQELRLRWGQLLTSSTDQAAPARTEDGRG